MQASPGAWLAPQHDRSQQRLLIIGPGFGFEMNPQQGAMIKEAGFHAYALRNLPNPETPGFQVHSYLPQLAHAINTCQPHLILCASKGGAYMVALWETGFCSCPTLMINKPPCLQRLPQHAAVVLAVGSNDEVYPTRREELEALMQTGPKNRWMLYYTGNSGLLGRNYTRVGDTHIMASLLQYNCLPRLCDAAMCNADPELHFMRSWDTMVTAERLEAERWLGHEPHHLRRLWSSADQKGMDPDRVLFQVPAGSEEYRNVEAIFRAMPAMPRAYADCNPLMWKHMNLCRVERVENGLQEDGSADPYYQSLRRSIEGQGVRFTPGVHTRWAFHGSGALESIVADPMSGFQPLMCGSRSSALWGAGTCFARDAKYVYDGGFCRHLPDGSMQMLLCLLMTGIPCLGDPQHQGLLPPRQGRHRYNSAVDSLSSPEIFVTQHHGAAYPAYVITFF